MQEGLVVKLLGNSQLSPSRLCPQQAASRFSSQVWGPTQDLPAMTLLRVTLHPLTVKLQSFAQLSASLWFLVYMYPIVCCTWASIQMLSGVLKLSHSKHILFFSAFGLQQDVFFGDQIPGNLAFPWPCHPSSPC